MRDQLPEAERHVDAGIGSPEQLSFTCESSGRCSLPSRHASPSSSGVTATGEKLDAGFDCTKPNPSRAPRE
jgi:hypothetical protein